MGSFSGCGITIEIPVPIVWKISFGYFKMYTMFITIVHDIIPSRRVKVYHFTIVPVCSYVRLHIGGVTAIDPIIVPHILTADTCESCTCVSDWRTVGSSSETDPHISASRTICWGVTAMDIESSSQKLKLFVIFRGSQSIIAMINTKLLRTFPIVVGVTVQ